MIANYRMKKKRFSHKEYGTLNIFVKRKFTQNSTKEYFFDLGRKI